MDRKAKYIEFCEKQSVPLHGQPWWLDVVCGGREHWDVALAFDAGENLTGALPFYFTKKLGLRIIKMPPLMDYNALIINLENQQRTKRYGQYAFEQRVMSELVAQLPRTAFFYQQFYPELENWLPFYWAGYRQTTTYTYRLEDLSDLNVIWDHFKSSVRTNIRNAERRVRVETSEEVETFYKIYSRSLERREVQVPVNFDLLEKMDRVLKNRQRRKIYIARDVEGHSLQAGLYVAWDAQTAYFLLWGIIPDKKQSHAIQLLFWQAIQDFSGQVEKIDFCGSIIPSMERMIRSFGGTRRPCFCIYKSGNKLFELLGILFNREYY